jgi:hypothetical protein
VLSAVPYSTAMHCNVHSPCLCRVFKASPMAHKPTTMATTVATARYLLLWSFLHIVLQASQLSSVYSQPSTATEYEPCLSHKPCRICQSNRSPFRHLREWARLPWFSWTALAICAPCSPHGAAHWPVRRKIWILSGLSKEGRTCKLGKRQCGSLRPSVASLLLRASRIW